MMTLDFEARARGAGGLKNVPRPISRAIVMPVMCLPRTMPTDHCCCYIKIYFDMFFHGIVNGIVIKGKDIIFKVERIEQTSSFTKF